MGEGAGWEERKQDGRTSKARGLRSCIFPCLHSICHVRHVWPLAMRLQGCEPDVVTFTALINAYEKGAQWRRALQVGGPVLMDSLADNGTTIANAIL